MQAAAGHAAAAVAQGFIGGGGPVARDDVERLLAARHRCQTVQQVKQRGVDGAEIVSAEIAQPVVDCRQGVRQLAAGNEIFDAQLLDGVQVVKTQGTRRAAASLHPSGHEHLRRKGLPRTSIGDADC